MRRAYLEHTKITFERMTDQDRVVVEQCRNGFLDVGELGRDGCESLFRESRVAA